MNKVIIIGVFILSIATIYLFFATPTSTKTNTINTKPIEVSYKSTSKIVVNSTVSTSSNNLENNKVETTHKSETKDNKISPQPNNREYTQNETEEENIYYKKVDDIEISLKSEDNQDIELDERGEEGRLQTPSFPSLLNAKVDNKSVLIQVPPNKNLILTLKNKNGVQVKYKIDSTSLSNGKIINVGEITPKNFNKAKSQKEIEESENIQDNIDTKIEEAKTDNNPNNSIVPPAPPPL
jgi:hypothetical protein